MLVLDAGNSLVGDRNPGLRTLGASSIALMNRMGYTAMTLALADIEQLGVDELRNRMAEADFPLLSANAYLSGTTELLSQPYVIVPLADHRVGILGLSEAGQTEEVYIDDPVAAARRWIPELQSQANIIILLSHAGVYLDQRIAEQVPGIDIVISGQNFPLDRPLLVESTGSLVFYASPGHPGYAGERMGLAKLTFDRQGRLSQHEWTRISLSPDYAEDPEINAFLAELGKE
jgi:2',3'-cyclic-nucleotide 2'-phosphodiesterase (5'-nucleotidase family)